ncbi:cytochrome-c peroxidase [Thalassotalea sp. HSM 43]|uniref:parallel beta-helix domain-containing protein n=1 Tax=Thalassotalea sp. HSM 43 TaxID=2552945 RepID=UPI001080D401|nr:parallel beta-helix domain-containing protein [Thalassotalea sp. HSM 43]QBY05354.1 cytochrome-c peroxidase [Thalassotalea sp. HSM 43]
MSKGKILSVVLIAAAFGVGNYYGGLNSSPVITSSSGGASFGGGYDKSQDQDASAEAVQQVQGEVRVVNDGESIMAAVKAANPGDTIQVMPGKYHETVYVDKEDIKIVGVIKEGARATMDGQGKLNDAILYSGNNFVVENMTITGYKGNGIMGQAGNNFIIRNNLIVDTGVYGIFPQLGKNGIVEHNVISGIEDAAIYVGMSDNIHVAHNEVFDSVAGIEIENSRHAIVENNYVHDNTGGILAFITPGLPIKTTYDVIIRNNFVVNNNTENFAIPGSTVAMIPAGSGIIVWAGDDVIIEGNIISNNKTGGILVSDHNSFGAGSNDPESEPNPDRTMILDNFMMNNGYDTIDEVKALLAIELKGSDSADIIKVGGGVDSCIINRHRYTTAGVSDWKECDFTNTKNIETYLLDKPVAPRDIDPSERGKIAYLGICTGCHTYTDRMIGPPVNIIQALYMDNPQGLADYIANPTKKREDYPEMPPQNYLDEGTRLAVAEYMLKTSN